MTDFWRDLVWTAMRNMGATLKAVVPSLLAMLTLVVLGTVLGRVAGGLLTRLLRAVDFDRRSRAWGLSAALDRAGIARPPSEVLRAVVFWGIFAILLQPLPRALTAVLILVVGWLAANFLGQTALIAAVNAGLPEARLLARAARWAVLLFAIATALTEVGIGRDMVLIAFGITFGGLVLSLALAFGLGGRVLARQMLERRLRRERAPETPETISHL